MTLLRRLIALIVAFHAGFVCQVRPAISVLRGPYLQSGSATGVVIRWRTDEGSTAFVRCGTNLADLNLLFESPVTTTEHQVQVTGLFPDTKYYYAFGNGDFVVGGPEYFFVTSPTQSRPIRVWVVGDSGTANINQWSVRDAFCDYSASRHTDLMLMLGDNAYSSGYDSQYQEALFDVYPDILRQTYLYPAIGNHEFYSTYNVMDFPYLQIFTLPAQGQAGGVPSGSPKYYSFDYGNVHFVCLDSMTSDRSSNGVMCTWLKEDLAANTNEWLIAFWHHPPYSKGSHNSDSEPELVQMRVNVIPVLESYGVDLVMCGHSHSYERSYLLRGHYDRSWTLLPEMLLDDGDGREDGTGPYVKTMVGPAANQGSVYVVAGSSGQTSGGTLNHPAMFVSLNRLGSVVLDVNGARLDAKFLRETGAIDDHFTLIKTVPTNVVGTVRLTLANGAAVLSWPSSPGTTYSIERADSLVTTGTQTWTTLTNVVATRLRTTWPETQENGRDPRFYRVGIHPMKAATYP